MLRALDLAEAIDNGDMTPSTVMALVSEAIAAQEDHVGAFTHLDLAQAEVDAASAAHTASPLKGLPFGIKDIFDTATMPTEYGSEIYAGWQPKADAAIVRLVKANGGIVVGKTVTTEFAHLRPGKTKNPHNAEYTPGGSSSGSAAAIAAGMLALSIGTQTGGSVIRPAAFCGVPAIKPSFRLLPMVGVKHFAWTLDTAGLFGARVVDVAFGLAGITGRDLRVDGADIGTPRIGILRQPYAGTPNAEAETALEQVITALEKAGLSVTEIDEPDDFANAHQAHRVINGYESSLALAWEFQVETARLSQILRTNLEKSITFTPQDYDDARRTARRARHAAKDVFAPFDALISFPAPGAAPLAASTGSATFNQLTTLLGIPAVHVPVMKTAENLPVGIQVLTSFGKDREALAIAAMIEELLATR